MITEITLGVHRELKIDMLSSINISGVWLELVDPTEEELRAVSEKTQISINFLRLPKSAGQVTLRIEPAFKVITFAVMQDISSLRVMRPILLAFSNNCIVTVANKEIQQIINYAKERMSKTKFDPPSEVAYFIIDEIVSSHFEKIEKIEELISQIEEEVVNGTSVKTLKKILNYKSKMIRFNKILWHERGVIFNLRKCGDDCMSIKAHNLFETTHEDLTRQIDIVETYREILSDSINVHLSAVSNKINLSIKSLTVVIFYLTIITVLTSFPNTVATFFGISQFGGTHVVIIFTAILASIILPVLWLWRKKWLKYE